MIFAAMSVAVVGISVVAAAVDVRSRRIPNVLTFPGLVLALALRVTMGADALASGLAGAAVGLGLGFVLFAVGALGGGDGKLMMALWALIGFERILPALLAMAIAGGGLAVSEIVRRGGLTGLVGGFARRAAVGPGVAAIESIGGRRTVPYGVAIALGAVWAWFVP